MTTTLAIWALVAVGGYLLGSIPFGLVLTRLAGLGDIREIGSGNIGATNVLRTGRKDLAALTLVLDAAKGGLAALIAWGVLDRNAALIAGGAAFLGHLYPVWLRFKGGKGVATWGGTLLAVAWPVGLLAAATWALMAAVFRWSSLAALTAALLAPLFAILPLPLGGDLRLVGLTAFTAGLIFWSHRANIARLQTGEEPKIGQKSE